RTWLAPIPKSRDHPLHRPFLDKLISENGPAENPQEIILNSLPCKCLFLWDLSRHRFQPDCLLRPLTLCLTMSMLWRPKDPSSWRSSSVWVICDPAPLPRSCAAAASRPATAPNATTPDMTRNSVSLAAWPARP